MKIVHFAVAGKARYGIINGDSVQAIEDKPFRYLKLTDYHYQLSEVKLLPPCMPSKIVALGLNYRHHAEELNAPLPNAPLIFLKPSTAVIGPEDNIIYPPASHRVDYEGELAVVIKKPVWRVSVQDALNYILGYTCFNDVTARDLQRKDIQWTRAKSFNTFAAGGPCIVLLDEVVQFVEVLETATLHTVRVDFIGIVTLGLARPQLGRQQCCQYLK